MENAIKRAENSCLSSWQPLSDKCPTSSLISTPDVPQIKRNQPTPRASLDQVAQPLAVPLLTCFPPLGLRQVSKGTTYSSLSQMLNMF